LLAMGQPKAANNLQMTVQGLRVVGLLAAIPWGLQGACWGLLAASALGAVASHKALLRYLSLSAAEVWRALSPSLALSLLAATPLLLAVWWVPMVESNYLFYVAGGALVTAALWLLLARPLGHPVANELQRLLGSLQARFALRRGSR
jgi:Polysaccharide biosynthesis C-terminal domain